MKAWIVLLFIAQVENTTRMPCLEGVPDSPNCSDYSDSCTAPDKLEICQRYCGICDDTNLSTAPLETCLELSTQCQRRLRNGLEFCDPPLNKYRCKNTCGNCPPTTSLPPLLSRPKSTASNTTNKVATNGYYTSTFKPTGSYEDHGITPRLLFLVISISVVVLVLLLIGGLILLFCRKTFLRLFKGPEVNSDTLTEDGQCMVEATGQHQEMLDGDEGTSTTHGSDNPPSPVYLPMKAFTSDSSRQVSSESNSGYEQMRDLNSNLALSYGQGTVQATGKDQERFGDNQGTSSAHESDTPPSPVYLQQKAPTSDPTGQGSGGYENITDPNYTQHNNNGSENPPSSVYLQQKAFTADPARQISTLSSESNSGYEQIRDLNFTQHNHTPTDGQGMLEATGQRRERHSHNEGTSSKHRSDNPPSPVYLQLQPKSLTSDHTRQINTLSSGYENVIDSNYTHHNHTLTDGQGMADITGQPRNSYDASSAHEGDNLPSSVYLQPHEFTSDPTRQVSTLSSESHSGYENIRDPNYTHLKPAKDLRVYTRLLRNKNDNTF